MNKTLIIIISTVLLGSSASSLTGFYPSPGKINSTGFLRVEPVTGIPQGRINASFILRSFSYKPPGYSYNLNGGSITFGLDYGLTNSLSARFWVPYYLDIESGVYDHGLGDITIGLRYFFEDIVSLEPYLITPTGKGIFGPENGEGAFRYFTTGKVDLGINVGLGYKIGDFRLTAAAGYLYHGFDDQYTGKLGVCYEADRILPFLEFIAEDRGGFGSDDPITGGCDVAYLTPGFVLNLSPNLSLLLCLDTRITWSELFGGINPPDWRNDHYITAGPGRSQPWALNVGLKYTDAQTVRKETILTGEVIDIETGNPLSAVINFPGSSLKPIRTDKGGRFSLPLREKSIDLIITAQGYKSVRRNILLKPGTTMNFLFSLTSETASLTLKVKDIETGKPIRTSVFIDKAEATITTASTDAMGTCRLILQAGNYRLEIVSSGYITASREITLDGGKVTTISFFLTKAPRIPEGGLTLKELKLLTIKFEHGGADLSSDALEQLDRAVITLKENPDMDIKIKDISEQGGLHTRRVDNVMSYLISKGISEERIKTSR